MKQIRVIVMEKNLLSSFYIGVADSIPAARQVVMEQMDNVETLLGLGGKLYLGQQIIG